MKITMKVICKIMEVSLIWLANTTAVFIHATSVLLTSRCWCCCAFLLAFCPPIRLRQVFLNCEQINNKGES